MGNSFRPRATLQLCWGLAGKISVKKTHFKLRNCTSRAVCCHLQPKINVSQSRWFMFHPCVSWHIKLYWKHLRMLYSCQIWQCCCSMDIWSQPLQQQQQQPSSMTWKLLHDCSNVRDERKDNIFTREKMKISEIYKLEIKCNKTCYETKKSPSYKRSLVFDRFKIVFNLFTARADFSKWKLNKIWTNSFNTKILW